MDIKATYYRKVNQKNYIYFECGKKNSGCKGKIKYDKSKDQLLIMKECDDSIIHDNCVFNEFYEDFNNENLKFYDLSLKKLQKFYIRALFKSGLANEITTAVQLFKSKTNIKLNLNNSELTYEKHLALGQYNSLDIISLCKKLSTEEIPVDVKSIDIFYDYTDNNKKILKREEKVIVITTQLMRKQMLNKHIDNFFIDVTYKIVPKFLEKYKLLTITGVDNETNNTYIIALILLKYEDTISFIKIFKYMKDMYNFNPSVVHIDYSLSLRKAFLSENLYSKRPIIVHCFFHFIQAIVKKMKKLDIIKKNITKRAFEIIKNIEIICFIPPNLIKKYGDFLKDNLKEDKELKLYNYINKNWISKDYALFSYYELFNTPSMIAGAEHFFVTNNIAETLHHKMNLYLPNKKINNHNFIISLRNVIKNYETLKTNIKRHDYITKSLIKYCKNITKNKFKWLDYETFKKLEKEVISNINDNIDINVIDELIESLNGFSIKDSDNKNSSNEVLENDINNQIDNDGQKKEYSSEDENEIFLDNINNNEEGKDDSIDEELFDELKNGDGISGMFVRLIEDKKNITCKDVIKNYVEKKIKKRSEIEDDSDMVEILKLFEKHNNKNKVKINYPKTK